MAGRAWDSAAAQFSRMNAQTLRRDLPGPGRRDDPVLGAQDVLGGNGRPRRQRSAFTHRRAALRAHMGERIRDLRGGTVVEEDFAGQLGWPFNSAVRQLDLLRQVFLPPDSGHHGWAGVGPLLAEAASRIGEQGAEVHQQHDWPLGRHDGDCPTPASTSSVTRGAQHEPRVQAPWTKPNGGPSYTRKTVSLQR